MFSRIHFFPNGWHIFITDKIRACKKPGCWSECRIKSPSVEVISLFRIFFVKITEDHNLSTWLYICASHFNPFFQFLAFIQGSFETMRGDALLFSLEENYPHSESDKKTDDQESILNIKHMLYKHTDVSLKIQENIVQVNYLRSIHTQMNHHRQNVQFEPLK